uniref:Uncharacterized protein n=1 Tax=Parascaris equorum TaxID=6256 RepID=A0A914S410_PAREQ
MRSFTTAECQLADESVSLLVKTVKDSTAEVTDAAARIGFAALGEEGNSLSYVVCITVYRNAAMDETTKPRESLLEVPSNVLSPKTLKGVRPKLEDVPEQDSENEELFYRYVQNFVIGSGIDARKVVKLPQEIYHGT